MGPCPAATSTEVDGALAVGRGGNGPPADAGRDLRAAPFRVVNNGTPAEERDVDGPLSLPLTLYVLAVDPDRHRVTGRGRLAFVLRAAALTELILGGCLEDVAGRPRARAAEEPPDPVLGRMWREIADSRPRSWRFWVRRRRRSAPDTVREQLRRAGLLAVHRGPVGERIEVTRPDLLAAVHARVDEVLHGTSPAAAVDRRDAALVALSALGGLPTVLPRRVRRRHGARIRELTERAGPAATALARELRRHRLVILAAGASGGQGG
jgi:hypothetical protein